MKLTISENVRSIAKPWTHDYHGVITSSPVEWNVIIIIMRGGALVFLGPVIHEAGEAKAFSF